MKKKLYVIGPSKSTGKTTLVNALALRLGLKFPAVVKEVARGVMATQGFSRKDVNSLKMQQAILVAHLDQEKEGKDCPIQICDRSAVDCIVYAVLTSATVEEAARRRILLTNTPTFQAALKVYRQSTFLLLAPIPEWLVDDGIRLTEQQDQCFDAFTRELQGLGIDFRVIGPDMRSREERVAWVLGLLKL
ncbi:hypothetical protein C0992_002472 [Termitomyces sp. T32_za158]|nr:hypothetical protein C0992_002472 [Termitomyces sp. T32_za158]